MDCDGRLVSATARDQPAFAEPATEALALTLTLTLALASTDVATWPAKFPAKTRRQPGRSASSAKPPTGASRSGGGSTVRELGASTR